MASNSLLTFNISRSEYPLPAIVKTRSGVYFNPNLEQWVFRDGVNRVSIRFDSIPNVCGPLIFGLKKTLVWYFENRAPGTVCQLFSGFMWLCRFLALDRVNSVLSISAESVMAFRSSSDAAGYRLAGLRSLLLKWFELGVPGVDRGAAELLSRTMLKQSPVGVAVATLDPEKGPLSDAEFEGLQERLNRYFSLNKINLENLLICRLLMSLGVRPIQLASLKCCDLVFSNEIDGDYVLKVPRAKQRGGFARSEFKMRKLVRQIGEPLAAHVSAVMDEYSGLLADNSMLPIFPQRQNIENSDAPGFEFHMSSVSIGSRASDTLKKIGATSERLDGRLMPISSIRLRRTFATRAAEEGWPILILAELMDHTNTKHVEVYAGLTSRIRAKFSRALAMEMAPISNAFNGRVISNESEASFQGFSSQIVDLRIDRNGSCVGSCGSKVRCGFGRPVACYSGCYDFEPWLDGPHEAVLDYLLDRREKLMKECDSRIAAINDRAILGCAQVVIRCKDMIARGG